MSLDNEADRAFGEFFERQYAEEQDLNGPIRGAWPKLRAIGGRLVLIVHLLRLAAGEDVDPLCADAESVRRAIILTDWFGHEARRVYAMRGESPIDRDQRKLVEWIGGQGGEVTPGKVQAGCRWLRAPGLADAALSDLVKAGAGEWAVESTATNQKRVFRLSVVSASTDSLKTRELGESADADNADNPETQTGPADPEDPQTGGEALEVGDDWGEL